MVEAQLKEAGIQSIKRFFFEYECTLLLSNIKIQLYGFVADLSQMTSSNLIWVSKTIFSVISSFKINLDVVYYLEAFILDEW